MNSQKQIAGWSKTYLANERERTKEQQNIQRTTYNKLFGLVGNMTDDKKIEVLNVFGDGSKLLNKIKNNQSFTNDEISKINENMINAVNKAAELLNTQSLVQPSLAQTLLEEPLEQSPLVQPSLEQPLEQSVLQSVDNSIQQELQNAKELLNNLRSELSNKTQDLENKIQTIATSANVQLVGGQRKRRSQERRRSQQKGGQRNQEKRRSQERRRSQQKGGQEKQGTPCQKRNSQEKRRSQERRRK